MKKVLIICYYWPPAGGPGVQRWLKFVKYLRDYELEPIVYVPENAQYPILDKSLQDEIPSDITVLQKPIWEPYAFAKIFSIKDTKDISSGIISNKNKQTWLQRLMLYIRGNFFIPDARKYWVKPSVRFLTNYLENNPVDAIVTTGPPHSLHLIGLSLKAKKNIPWLADFRDPWTTIGYHSKLKLTARSRAKHNRLEQKVLQEANHIVVTSPTTQKDFTQLTDTPITCITNGYEEYKLPIVNLDKKFTLAHIGSLLSERNPKILWKVLSALKQEVKGFDTDLKLSLSGKVSQDVLRSITEYGLEKNLEVKGYLSHREALIAQREAQVLLLIEIDNKDTQAIIPGKIFEYLAARRPILGMGPSGSDFFKIVSDADAGASFTYNQDNDLKAYILDLYTQFCNEGIKENKGDISQYSRQSLTKNLAEVLHNLIASK